MYTYTEWQPYKLGDEIHPDYEYRKIEKWCVIYNMNMDLEICNKSKHPNLKEFEFEGTIQECEKWVEEHTKKTWLDERKSCLSASFEKKEINLYEAGAKEVCKKILEELNRNGSKWHQSINHIIKDLGVEL